MAAPSRPPTPSPMPASANTPEPTPDPAPDANRSATPDPDGGSGGIHELLTKAVEEAARLLDADGAMVYLIDPSTGNLRFAHDAGIRSERSRAWVRGLELAPGTGMFGRAVVERAVIVTDDYGTDPSFRHATGTDRVVADIGIRSMVVAPLVAGDQVFGALGTFSTRAGAFDQAQIALVRSLADHAAAAMANTRLIEDLDRSRTELAERAEAERALRDINVRISAAADLSSVLQLAVDEAARLLQADGARIDLVDPDSGLLRWAYASGALQPDDEIWPDDPDETLDQGISGQAVVQSRPFWTGDYQRDERFPHGRGADTYVDATGIRSVMAAPLVGESGAFGALTTFTDRADAWGEAEGGVLEAIAGQAAIAITNARLIGELERSREENAQRADAERTLREIAARVSSILDPATVLTQIVAESARLLGSDGARIDLWDERIGALRWAYSTGDAMSEVPEWGRTGGLKPRQAVAGLAFHEQRPVMTEDFLADDRFDTTPEIEAFVRTAGIRAVIAAPLAGEGDEPLGVLSVVSRQPGAYTDTEVELLTALATHASIAITNAHLMEELARSREDIERRAEAEASLRQIAARITALREPDEVLQHVIDEAQRLLRADGALIDQYDPETGTLTWAYDAGIPEEQREALRMTNLHLGEGASGQAVAEGRVVHVGDYLEGEFRHDDLVDSLVERAGIRDLIVAPIIGDAGPLGAIEVMSRRPHAFDDFDAAVLGSLAEQAAIAITNARLIEELERSRLALARRAETERSLRDITARIAALTDPDEVLERVVNDARRLLATDGAHLTRMGPTGTYLVPVVVAGAGDDATRAWLMGMEFPLGAGINGLAAQSGEPVWTFDYLADPRIPHEPDDQSVAERLALRGMAAAPLRAPGGEVMGTLAISTAQPRIFEADDLDLLQGLADQAAIALTNSNLLARLTREEARFRGLVQTTPDVIWHADERGVFTFMADTGEALFGWPIEDIVGQQFAFLTHADSMPLALERYQAVGAEPGRVERVLLTLVRRDGSTFAAEVTTTGVFENGRWVGAQGTVRDISERERLERDLRQSEERYRFLVQNAPDLVWSIGPDARITFLSHAVERLTGFRPDELIGQHFGAIVHESSREVAEIDWTEAMRATSEEVRGRLSLRHRDGSAVPAEFVAIASLDADGTFRGANGSVRDMRERDRLERELRASEDRYRTLASSSPDLVFATDADGRYTFLSDRAQTVLGWDKAASLGRHFMEFVAPGFEAVAAASYQEVVADPDQVHSARMDFLDGSGRPIPLDINIVGRVEDGALVGINGVARDMSERTRLERELRRQAGELAAGEERAHLARELHDSVTQALFSMTLVSKSAEMLLATDPEAARTHLTQLRELQREALAEMRALIFELRPGNLESDGLVRALKTHSAALQGRLGLPVVVESDLEDRLPLAAEEVLYRIAQEALHNVVKHAAARQVRVQVQRVDGGVRLRVEDDGKGFDPMSVPDGHLGLAGMRARAERVGATFACHSQPGKGTSIEVALAPLALAELQAAAAIGGAAAADLSPIETPSIRDR